MTLFQILRGLIALQRLIDLIIEAMAERAKAEDLNALNLAIDEARAARTSEAKIAAAKKISEALSSGGRD